MGFFGPHHTKRQHVALPTTLTVLLTTEVHGRDNVELSLVNAAGGKALADVEVDTGPTDDGPWFSETVPAGAKTLAAGASIRFNLALTSRWVRVSAKSAADAADCDLTVYLSAQ